ncbi:MAG: hypothetical protein ACI9BO_002202 [Zhongshania sp.]|jgi:hypothetical protein
MAVCSVSGFYLLLVSDYVFTRKYMLCLTRQQITDNLAEREDTLLAVTLKA